MLVRRAWLSPRATILEIKSGRLTALDCGEPGGSMLTTLAGTGDPELQAISPCKEEQLTVLDRGC